MARQINFNPDSIRGTGIITDKNNPDYGRHRLKNDLLTCSNCQAIMFAEEKTGGTNANPIFTLCCAKKKVKLPEHPPPPPLLMRLFNGTDIRSEEFLRKIRLYNSVFAFTSFNSNVCLQINKINNILTFSYNYFKLDKKLANMQHGVYTFRVDGCIYHKHGALLPANNETPKHGQIWFVDEDAQENIRASIFPKQLSKNLIREIQNKLVDINPLAKQYRAAAELIKETPNLDLKIVLHQGNHINYTNLNNPIANTHYRRYNKPEVEEVAAIVIGNDEDRLRLSREIHLYKHDGNLQIISDDHPNYDSLHYVLAFPYAPKGWGPRLWKKIQTSETIVAQNDLIENIEENNNLIEELNNSTDSENSLNTEINDFDDETNLGETSDSNRSKYVSCCEFYSYLFQRRQNSYLHMLKNSYQQIILDNYLKVEHQKLKFIQFNQNKLRVELYKGLVDLMNKGDTNLENSGKKLILPSSFVGGPRYMLNLYQDAMAIVRTYGKPDLFITVTCNPHWPEIKSKLLR
jgi:hypothetical protein